jgi:hypothetical protein
MTALRKFDLRNLVIGAAWLLATGGLQYLIHEVQPAEVAFVEMPADYVGLSVDPRIVRRLLGIRLVAADLVWIDTIIKSDTSHEKKAFTPLYRAFETILALDPDNIIAYYVAGAYLSVVKDDVHGATAILRKGVDYMRSHPYSWPDAWSLPWTLGYNLVFEENDVEDGARWIKMAAEMPHVPPMVRKIASHVETERGQLEVAERVINDAYRRATRPEEKKAIEMKMVELGVRHELLDLNDRFKAYLSSTKAGAFSRKRQFEVFKRAIGHSGRDMLGRPLEVNDLGRIEPKSAH